jgi:four helix bundle protein
VQAGVSARRRDRVACPFGEGLNMEKVEELDVFKLSRINFEILKSQSFPTKKVWAYFPNEASYSIPMNLMEGAHRLGSKEYRQFVGIAKGSAGEIKYQLLVVKDLRYISEDRYSNLKQKYERVSQMLTKLARSLERD